MNWRLNAYNSLDTGTGSNLSNFQNFTLNQFGQSADVISNTYALGFTWHITNSFVLGGWGSYVNASNLDTLGGQINRGNMDIWNWAVTMAFPDLFKEGSKAGIILGMEPWVANSTIMLSNLPNTDNDSSFHIEAFYEYAVTDNIKITPAIILITSPNYNNNNSALVIGAIRTTFTF